MPEQDVDIRKYLKNMPEITQDAMSKAIEIFEVALDQDPDEIKCIISTIARLQVVETVLLSQLPFGAEKNRDFYNHVCCHVILDLVSCGALTKEEAKIIYPNIPYDEVFKNTEEQMRKDALSDAACSLKESQLEVEKAKST